MVWNEMKEVDKEYAPLIKPVRNLPDGVSEHLQYYVYLYVDPRNNLPFYVGKGKGDRIFFHFDDVRDSEKVRLITEIHDAGLEPRLEILAHGLEDEETAFRVEAAVIDSLGLSQLSNQVRGWQSVQTGRMTIDQLAGYYAAKPVELVHPILLIRINKLYRHNMSPEELYEATRGIWRLGERRYSAKYALAVFEGIVREVYEISNWYPARTTQYKTRDFGSRDIRGRWEFVGIVAPNEIRDQYIVGSVRAYLHKGNQSPVVYVNI